MKSSMGRRIGLLAGAGVLAASFTLVDAQQRGTVAIDPDDR